MDSRNTSKSTLTPEEVLVLPDLDAVVVNGLSFLAGASLPQAPTKRFRRPLVVGSVNAALVGEALFAATDATFATEGTVKEKLQHADVDGVVIVSASGAKDAPAIVRAAKEHAKPVCLLTNTEGSPAASLLNSDSGDEVVVFPKQPEPYTYNLSTYLSMLLAGTGEDPASIANSIESEIAPRCLQEELSGDAFTLVVPEGFDAVAGLLQTKFDELFGRRIAARVFTETELRHAKTVVPTEGEKRIVFTKGGRELQGEGGLSIPLPVGCSHAGLMAVGYFVIGKIQGAHPPYFKENIIEYLKKAEKGFGESMPLIVA